jgi:hypothetical protein
MDKETMTTEQQYRWAAGSGGVDRPIPRVDKLAKLYKERDALEVNPVATRDDWLRLAASFAELNAGCSAQVCYWKAGEL